MSNDSVPGTVFYPVLIESVPGTNIKSVPGTNPGHVPQLVPGTDWYRILIILPVIRYISA